MIGIIGAMDIEVASFIEKLSEKKTADYSGITYVGGKFGETDVVVAKCGIGKVNAAICAQTMILMYSPETVINTGVAGSISSDVKIGDIVIGKNAIQHDLDLSPLNIATDFIFCTPRVVAQLENAAKEVGKYFVGSIATGDQFINDGDIKAAIFSAHNALACEMEGASIAQVCTQNNVDFGLVRAISDNADDDSNFDFNEFLRDAAQKSVEIICRFIKST